MLELGLGRAILHLKEHGATQYRDIILHACLHSSLYDAQVEDNRVPYLLEAINLTGDAAFFEQQILAALPITHINEYL
jgi:hypothetical protein